MNVYVSDLEREQLPQAVGPYLLVDVLGSGGMGCVFRARSLTEHGGYREHAVKVLRDAVDTEIRRAMFVREARIGRLLRHENVVRTTDYFVFGEERFLVMELVEGASLADLVNAREEPLPPQEAAALVAQAARGLQAIHQLRDEGGQLYGLVHRDVKPDNLLVRSDGVVKVADFGVAKPTRIDMTAYVTAEAEAGPTGTLPYMSPEQVRGQPLDPRSDIWAMGCVLYYAMTGRSLFGADASLAILTRVLRLDFFEESDPYRRVDDLLPGAGSVLRRCVTPRPEDRFPDAAQLTSALEFLPNRSTARKTLALISGENLPAWMGVDLNTLPDPRTVQAIPVAQTGAGPVAPTLALQPLGEGGVQGELVGRGAVVMKVIQPRRPGGTGPPQAPTPNRSTTPPPTAAPREVRAEQPRPALTADATASLERRRARAHQTRKLWLLVATVGGVLLLAVVFVIVALSVAG